MASRKQVGIGDHAAEMFSSCVLWDRLWSVLRVLKNKTPWPKRNCTEEVTMQQMPGRCNEATMQLRCPPDVF